MKNEKQIESLLKSPEAILIMKKPIRKPNGQFRPRKPSDDEDAIMDYFYSHEDNTDKTIAEYFGLRTGIVTHIIATNLNNKMKRINKEIDNRLKQRNEPKQNNQDTLKS